MTLGWPSGTEVKTGGVEFMSSGLVVGSGWRRSCSWCWYADCTHEIENIDSYFCVPEAPIATDGLFPVPEEEAKVLHCKRATDTSCVDGKPLRNFR